jgi:ribose/xylose/arabinose/galactoside ABC-type transport system permease subunit
MVFEDSSRYLGEGLGAEYVPPRRDTTSFEVVPVLPGTSADPDPTVAIDSPRSTPNLYYVFDDPADGEPGRDRMMVHGLWELVLALALAGVGYLLYQVDSSAFDADGLRRLALGTAAVGLIASAMALSLRAGVPNLAVGGIAVVTSLYFGQHAGSGTRTAVLLALAICAGAGLLLGLVIVGLHVPAWAAGLGALLGLFAWSATQGSVTISGYDPQPHAYLWFGGFCALSLVGSAAGLFPVLRRAFGRFRPVADPAHRRGAVAAVIAVAALVGSALLAGAGGLLNAFLTGHAAPGDGLDVTALALGAALLGGTSAFGRRGGIFGTIFASALLVVSLTYAATTDRTWPQAAFAAAAIALGLGVTRLIERFGRPSPVSRRAVEDAWEPKVHALAPATRSWQPAPTPAAGGLWASDDAWGTIDQR